MAKVSLDYTKAGVDTDKEEEALKRLLKWTNKSLLFRKTIGAAKISPGFFANVIDMGDGIGLALSTDGVGTKILVAELMEKYDTIGIDCVAMNVNDVICVGAEPVSMLDYLAVQESRPDMIEEIAKGLYQGAKMANINIIGGEIAQLRDMIKGEKEGAGFDLAGMAIGRVALNKLILGQDIQQGDIIIGLRSSGIHSNGLTLARKIFFKEMGFTPAKYFKELERTIGEELLEPTHIYVPEILALINSGIKIKALINVTSDGLLNLSRAVSEMGYIIDYIPEPQPIFHLIQKMGKVSDEEMFRVFNMGIGFCVVISEKELEKARTIFTKYRIENCKIGYAVKDREKKVIIKPYKLVGKGGKFYKAKSVH